MYCSDECELKAFEEYHRYECEIRYILQTSNNNIHTSLLILFKALYYCDGSVNELMNLIGSHLEIPPSTTAFDFNCNSDISNRLKVEKDLLVLLSSTKISLDNLELFNAFMMQLYSVHSILGKATKVQQDFISKFVLNVYLIGPKIYFDMQAYNSNLKNHELSTIATAYCPTLSLLNHSCIPNVSIICHADKLIVVATEPIPAGQQLFYCYG